MASSRERDERLRELGDRFRGIARRRVPEDAVDDLVQDALRIILEKDGDPSDLPWCFQVLRNTIGNWYQKQEVRSRELAPEDAALPPAAPTPLEALEDRDLAEIVDRSVAMVEETNRNCGSYLRRLMAGDTPASIADDEGVEAAVMYRRIYRCRGKLREVLREKGVRV